MARKEKKKIFVIDTNVILHDHKSILSFEENDVYLPIIVLEELDKFKKGNDTINYQAREFVRLLDNLTDGKIIDNKGVSLGEGKGVLKIINGVPPSEKIKKSFTDDIPDHRILATAEYLKTQNPEIEVILVTKDINLRMKGKSLGISVEDYKNDKIIDGNLLSKSIGNENVSLSAIESLYKENSLSFKDSGILKEPLLNQYLILNSEKTALARYSLGGSFKRVEKKNAYGIKPRNSEQTFLLDALLDPEIKLVSVTGKAGTGKTLLALASALEQCRNEIYSQVLLARPIVSLSNKDLGFLPGDADEKIRPYMQPLFDNLAIIKNNFSPRSKEHAFIDEMEKKESLIITALAYIRGRSLSNSYFIVDEAQNLTPHEVKTITTRAGEGTKLVFTGDTNQIDSPYLDQNSNGLSFLTDRMRGQGVFAHINLVKGERSYLAELAASLL